MENRPLRSPLLVLMLTCLLPSPLFAQVPLEDYARGKPQLPNVFAPYSSVRVPAPNLANSPRIEQLIREGKLYLSVQDAIELALENNLDISIARYNPPLAHHEI